MNVFDLNRTKSALKIHISFSPWLPVAQCALWKMTHSSPRPLDIQAAKLLLLTNGLLKDSPQPCQVFWANTFSALPCRCICVFHQRAQAKGFEIILVKQQRWTLCWHQSQARKQKPWCAEGDMSWASPSVVQLSLRAVCAAKPPSWRKGMLIQYSWWHSRGWVFWFLCVMLF